MTRVVPAFPLLTEPGEWDTLTLVASNAFLEGEGEPYPGILGICWVVRRRAIDWGLGWHKAILGPDGRAYDDGKPIEAFSAWNDDYRVRARARLSAATEAAAEPCWRAAASALWELEPDPVGGASFYLNVPLTLKIRGGTLPTWAAAPNDAKTPDPAKVTKIIGRHHFLVS